MFGRNLLNSKKIAIFAVRNYILLYFGTLKTVFNYTKSNAEWLIVIRCFGATALK